ncbi:MAG: ABC transporter ATP-binding protein [Chromatiales bacterium]|nr:ABC transporter ATP-binding protein [Chromatiales bacterium]
MMAGLEEHHRGDAAASTAERSTTCRRNDRDVAMVFQNYALYPHMTVRRKHGLRAEDAPACPSAEIDRRVGWAAETPGPRPNCSTASPRQLSGGQRQRVAMGRAIVRKPSGLPDGRAVVQPGRQAAGADAHRDRPSCTSELGTTMIYVTHDQVEAMTLGDRVAVPAAAAYCSRSRRPETLYERPANVFVAGFIGNPPMNLFPTVLCGGADRGLWIKPGRSVPGDPA